MAGRGNAKILDNIVKSMKNEDADPLSPLIDRYLIRRTKPEYRHLRLEGHEIDLKDRPRPLGRISPSSLGGCERQAVFKFLGVQGKVRLDPDLEMVFEDGHWRHHKWQAIAIEMERILGKKTFQCLAIEEPVQMDKLFVAGNLDIHCLVKYRGELEPWVIDIKGINSFGFQDLLAKQAPKEAHVMQLLGYMAAKKCQRGALLYECKNTNRRQIFVIRFSDEEWAETRKWCKRVIRRIKYTELPRRHVECDSGTFLYEKCPYRGLCFGNKTDAQIEREVYKGFTSIEDLWEQGLQLASDG